MKAAGTAEAKKVGSAQHVEGAEGQRELQV